MQVWAIGDLHLSFGVKDKKMDVFGPAWEDHAGKIADNWQALIKKDDLVLIPGDISWAIRPEEALPDLEWIDSLPGTKVMIKGNHDYWWRSLKKVTETLPPSIHIIQNNAFFWKGVAVGGARLWDTPEYCFEDLIAYQENPLENKESRAEIVQEELNLGIFNRELTRLKMSLQQLNQDAKVRIAMTHYPPIGADLKPSRTSQILEQNQIDICVFGHLHSLNTTGPLFGEKNGIRYELTSCDFLQFKPIQIL